MNTKTLVLTLPNGLVGRGVGADAIREVVVRELDGDDEDLLRDDTDAAKDRNVINQLLKSAIVRIGDETSPAKIKELFNRHFLLADLTFVLIKLRVWSIGDTYHFDYSCPKCKSIRRYKVDLTALVVTEQPDAYRGLAEDIEVTHEGHTFVIRQLMAERGTALMRAVNEDYPKEKGTRELLMQLLKIDGEKLDPVSCKKLSWRKRQFARQAMETTIGGIDTELEMRCRRCSATFRDNMPIHLRDFFFPGVETSECQTARPFRDSGTTPSSSERDGAGAPEMSES